MTALDAETRKHLADRVRLIGQESLAEILLEGSNEEATQALARFARFMRQNPLQWAAAAAVLDAPEQWPGED